MTAIPEPKKRLMFVDDETSLLELYKHVFEDEQDRWDISFAPSAEAALAMIEEKPMDVLVSDMCMPGMDGAELLREVMKRHPKTSRLIMSGYAHAEQIAQCLSATHQFIAKPFDLKTIRGIISRVCSLDAWLLDEHLQTLVAQLGSLPSLPTLYFRIMEALNSPDSSMEQIGEIIASDPSMTAKILQLVNSAFFGIARRLTNPVEAVQFLGIGRVRSLILSLHIFSCFDEAKIPNFSIERVWSHSIATGLVAQKIAREQKADRAFIDEAYVAGMLHDIGKVLLAASRPAQYEEAVSRALVKKKPLIETEREVFGVNHAQVGAYLLGLWGLPITIVEAVAFHHEPQLSGVKCFSPLTTVHCASAYERQLRDAEASSAETEIDTTYLAELGLAGKVDAWRNTARDALSN